MTTLTLVDPWAVEVGGGEPLDAKLEALVAYLSSVDTRRMTVMPFLSVAGYQAFLAAVEFPRALQRLRHDLWRLTVAEAAPASAQVRGSPVPHLADDWLGALAAAFHATDPSRWRDPVVFVPAARRDVWPSADEARVEVDGCSGLRCLVNLNAISEHRHFLPDHDPWIVHYEPDGISRILPKPAELEGVPLDQIREVVAAVGDWRRTVKGVTLFCYRPPLSWGDPKEIGREDWRNRRVFPRASADNNRSGPVDREGRIWVWDTQHNDHWDVQINGGAEHVNVSPAGRELARRS